MHDLVKEICGAHRERRFFMKMRIQACGMLTSFVRQQIGWRLDLPLCDRKRLESQALRMAKEGVEEGHPLYKSIAAASCARRPFDKLERDAKKKMEDLAKQLPVWQAWGEDVRAFGPLCLAIIVGEAGNLSSYETHSKLWKRMGLAVIDGVRQGGLNKSAPKEDWIAHGYNGNRRSQMSIIGESLIRGGEFYRKVYLLRKKYERAQAGHIGLIVSPAGNIPKGQEYLYISDGHIHQRSKRYMEKKLLRDLWNAWRHSA